MIGHLQFSIRFTDEIFGRPAREDLHCAVDIDMSELAIEARDDVRQVFGECSKISLADPQRVFHAKFFSDVPKNPLRADHLSFSIINWRFYGLQLDDSPIGKL